MNSRVAFPFLTLSEIAVQPSCWMIAKGSGDLEEASDFLADWDYATPLRVRRSISINREIAASELQLADDLALGASLRIGTGPGRLPRAVIHQSLAEIPCSGSEVELDVTLPGEVLSSVLHLRLDVVLVGSGGEGGELSPRRRGDRLWQDERRIRLEGEEPRFPIEVANFRSLLGDTAAAESPWYVHWSPRDWSRDFHGSMRLYLNSNHEDLISRIELEDPETLRFLMADVMGQVCESLAREAEAESILENCDQGSLGSQAALWLQLAFPGQDLAAARSVLENRPGVFRAAFQAVAEQKGGNA